MKNKFVNYIPFLIIFFIVLNFLLNLLEHDLLANLNLFDIVGGLLLFAFIYNAGNIIDQLFAFKNISISIVLYLFSFYVLDIIILFFYKYMTFRELFLIVNLIWILTYLIKKREVKYLVFGGLEYITLNLFVERNVSALTVNQNIIGDVEAVFFEQTKNIFEVSYYFSINNYVIEGYPQFTSYLQALFLQIANFSTIYNYFSFTSHIVFYLTILFFFELNLAKKNKIILTTLFVALIGNSDWIQFLFTTSLMSEGLVSLITAIVINNIFDQTSSNKITEKMSFFLLGMMYLSKQFNSTIVLIFFIAFIFYKKRTNLVFFGFAGFLINELAFMFIFPNVSKEHHIRQIDLKDTILDLVLFRDLKFENILLIIKNLWIDKPFVLVIVIFYITFVKSVLENTNLDFKFYSIFLSVNLNFLLIFALYISAWKNMELESPIRYMFNMLHLTLISIFINLEKSYKL